MSSFLLQFLSDEERNNVEERMKFLLKELEEAATPAASETDSNGTSNGHSTRQKRLKELKSVHPPRRSPRKTKPVHSFSPVRSLKKTPSKSFTETRKRKIIVPATPDEVLIKKSKSDSNLPSFSEVIAETPSDQMRKKLKDRDGKALLQVYVKAEEMKEQKRRISRRLSFVPEGTQLSNSIKYSSSKNSTVIISQSTQVGRASLSRVSSMKSMSSISTGFSSLAPASATSSKPPTVQSSKPATAQSSKNLNAANCLTDDILARYKKRMELVRSQSKKADSNEIFYGRSAGRVNLFSEEEMAKQEEEDKRQTRSQTQTSQKNRSGRKVTQDAGMVYVAHTLLNAHNSTPLLPFKPPKDAPFKIRKLVKHATRADWKKLQKFIQKSQNDEASQRSAS